jgi:hypothetical protein
MEISWQNQRNLNGELWKHCHSVSRVNSCQTFPVQISVYAVTDKTYTLCLCTNYFMFPFLHDQGVH